MLWHLFEEENNHVSVDHFCPLYSLALIFMWSLRPLLCCFHYYSFIISLKVRSVSPLILFFFKIVLSILGPLNFHIHFRVSLLIVELWLGFWWLTYDERNIWYFWYFQNGYLYRLIYFNKLSRRKIGSDQSSLI